jgi:hypothetical protein
VASDLQSLAVAPVALRTLAAASMEGARCVWTDGVSEFGRDDKVFRIWQSGEKYVDNCPIPDRHQRRARIGAEALGRFDPLRTHFECIEGD